MPVKIVSAFLMIHCILSKELLGKFLSFQQQKNKTSGCKKIIFDEHRKIFDQTPNNFFILCLGALIPAFGRFV